MFLFNCPPRKPIGCDTSYYRMYVKHADLSFLRTIGTRPHGGRQAYVALTSRYTRFSHYLQPQKQIRTHWLLQRFTRHRQPEQGEVYIREHVHSLWGVVHFSARMFCENKETLLLAGQGSYSSQSKHLVIRCLALRDWVMDEKLVIDHISRLTE